MNLNYENNFNVYPMRINKASLKKRGEKIANALGLRHIGCKWGNVFKEIKCVDF